MSLATRESTQKTIHHNTRLLRSNNHSGYRGISKTRDGRWMAQVRPSKYKSKYLGIFNTPEEAAEAYDDEVFQIRGFHAVLNFPERYRHVEYDGDAARVPVAGGYVIVDRENVPLILSNHCTIERITTRSPSVYIVYNTEDGSTEKRRLAAVLLNLEKGEPSVFINGNRFDHRLENLLSGKSTGNTTAIQNREDVGSGLKGVMAHMPSMSFNARLWHNGKAVSLGYFRKIEDAAKAYDAKARELWGEDALTNERIGAKPNEKTLELEKKFLEFEEKQKLHREEASNSVTE